MPPIAVDDYDSTSMNIPVMIAPMANDISPVGGAIGFAVLEGPHHGTINALTDSTFTYTPNKDFIGIDSISYDLYDSDPIPQHDTGMIYIKVGDGIPIVIHNVITPNGDGLNERWIIEGIEEYPENTVLIFNRWGDEIRKFEGYDNSSVVWNGTNKHGEPVPDGTYFYIVKIAYIQNYQGWIFVRANSD